MTLQDFIFYDGNRLLLKVAVDDLRLLIASGDVVIAGETDGAVTAPTCTGCGHPFSAWAWALAITAAIDLSPDVFEAIARSKTLKAENAELRERLSNLHHNADNFIATIQPKGGAS